MDIRRKPLGALSGHNLYQLSSFNPAIGISLAQQAAQRSIPATTHVLRNRAGMLVNSGYGYLSGLWRAARERVG